MTEDMPVTSRGPQRNEPVEVLRGDDVVARATCFMATYEEDGVRRWRGFLASIDPPGSIAPGEYRVRLEDGATAAIAVREVRTDPREQAIFGGVGEPPA